ncbi:hypothetical protein HDU92_007765 [Lobulomyces angularis]|nr:hypothetical protein HDU92_007765 [Lobulomyces angularis]
MKIFLFIIVTLIKYSLEKNPLCLNIEDKDDDRPCDKMRLILIGLSGSGKSTLANMIIEEKISSNTIKKYNINNDLIGTNINMTSYYNRNWFITETAGFEDYLSESVDKEQRANLIYNFLDRYSEPYHYYIYVLEAGRNLKKDQQLFNMYKDIFQGCEKNFIMTVTGADEKWMQKNNNKNRDYLNKIYGRNITKIALDLIYDIMDDMYRIEDRSRNIKNFKKFLVNKNMFLCEIHFIKKYRSFSKLGKKIVKADSERICKGKEEMKYYKCTNNEYNKVMDNDKKKFIKEFNLLWLKHNDKEEFNKGINLLWLNLERNPLCLDIEDKDDDRHCDKVRLILIGLSGSGKSTLANMIIEEQMSYETVKKYNINNDMIGPNIDMTSYYNRDWFITDTTGFDEYLLESIYMEQRSTLIYNFLSRYSEPYHYYIYVLKAGRNLKQDQQLFNIYKTVFHGCEKNFIITISAADEEWMQKNNNKNRDYLNKMYGKNITKFALDLTYDIKNDMYRIEDRSRNIKNFKKFLLNGNMFLCEINFIKNYKSFSKLGKEIVKGNSERICKDKEGTKYYKCIDNEYKKTMDNDKKEFIKEFNLLWSMYNNDESSHFSSEYATSLFISLVDTLTTSGGLIHMIKNVLIFIGNFILVVTICFFIFSYFNI